MRTDFLSQLETDAAAINEHRLDDINVRQVGTSLVRVVDSEDVPRGHLFDGVPAHDRAHHHVDHAKV